jgi:hypothetical protein
LAKSNDAESFYRAEFQFWQVDRLAASALLGCFNAGRWIFRLPPTANQPTTNNQQPTTNKHATTDEVLFVLYIHFIPNRQVKLSI